VESTITSKGQTTIPKAVRERLGLKPGDRVRFFFDLDGHVAIRPVIPVSRLAGIVKYHGPPATLEDMENAVAEGAVEGSGIVPGASLAAE
jgi:antitoxin PrlF